MNNISHAAPFASVIQLMKWKRYKEALVEAEHLLTAHPEDPYLFALIARIYSLQDQHEKALHWAREALTRDPEQPLAWYVRVCVYYETDDERAFGEAIEQALRIDPYEADYYFFRANRLLKKGKFQASKEQLEAALEIAPEHSLYLSALSYVEALLGNSAASRQLDRQAARHDVEQPYVLLHLAWAAGRRGEYELQETYMKQAVRLNPDDKQFQNEYLEALQHNNKLFRLFLGPVRLLQRLKTWQILVSWIVAWLLFKPLVLLFILLYVLAHWLTKAVVHVRVFGFRRRP